MSVLTHDDLTHIAYRWLKNKSYGLVLCEFVTATSEIPDAIGFKYHYSCVIECKVSRADFLRDKKKHFRHYGGMGNYRYYMAPVGLIKPEELPENWGLIEVTEKGRSRIVKDAVHSNRDFRTEHSLLYSICRRIEIRGLLHHALAGKALEAHNGKVEP